MEVVVVGSLSNKIARPSFDVQIHQPHRVEFLGFPERDDVFITEFGWMPILTGMVAILNVTFNGLYTNGKFCMVRTGQLHLNHWRRPLRLRTPKMVYSSTEKSDCGGNHETPMEDPSRGTGVSERAGALGSSLSADLGDNSLSSFTPETTESGGKSCK